MKGMRAFRAAAALTTIVGALLVAPGAEAAGPYAIDAHVDGVAGGGNYTPTSFHWTDTFEITFSHTTDATSVALMQLAVNRTEVPSAVVHETLQGTALVTLQMTGVHIEAVHEDSSVNNANGPEETVVLRYKKVVYTFQPVNAAGQKAGAPVTITYNR